MPKINLIVEVLDKKQSYIAHGKYDTDTRIVEIQRGFRKTVATKFLIDPEHIFRLISGNRISLKAYVDNASRKSVSIKAKVEGQDVEVSKELATSIIPGSPSTETKETMKGIDGKQKNTLDYLIEEVFWKSIIAKNKIPLSTILIMFMAGGGIFFLIRDLILPLFGVHA